jgi:hypothetical protein
VVKINQWGKRVSAPGCDDAPVVCIERKASAHNVQIIMPYYENPKMLGFQIAAWDALPEEFRDKLTVIIVDDGSPHCPALPVVQAANPKVKIRVFRIDVDVRWNWLAARNLGMHQAVEGWCFLTDMDHVLPMGTVKLLVEGVFNKEHIYRLLRHEHTGKVIAPHPNTWFFTREMFWKIGGYDEALSGYYGTDGEFRRRCAATAPVKIMIGHIVRHEFQLDASTTHYERKQPEDAVVREMISARSKDWKPKTLSFPWSELL